MHKIYLRITLITQMAISLAGCVPYPVLKTLQPSARVVVFDERGDPLAGANVTLISNAYPYGFERSRDSKMTAIDGIAQFEVQREFRIEAIAIHGKTEFFWNWCIQKDGFKTVETTNTSASAFEREFTAVLVAGTSTPCRKGMRL